MFLYEKKLQYPVRITRTNPKLASFIISQYGGPDGELGASLRYLSQRYSMPYPELKGLLTDIGTEELGHLEMIGAIVHQLTRNLTEEQIRAGGFAPYFVDHTTGIYPTAASGSPWNAAGIGVKGDVIADLTEDMAAEQKARVTYDNILRLSDDPDVTDVIRFLREREIVHFQRFGEANRTRRKTACRRMICDMPFHKINRYAVVFQVTNRVSIAATSARVLSPLGINLPWASPVRIPRAQTHAIASWAQLEMSALS